MLVYSLYSEWLKRYHICIMKGYVFWSYGKDIVTIRRNASLYNASNRILSGTLPQFPQYILRSPEAQDI